MSKHITGNMQIALSPVTVAKPSEALGYLVAARKMLEGALLLGSIRPIPVFPLTLLCGHSCEAALKAMLAQNGIEAKKLVKEYGHNICKLWVAAVQVGLQLPQPQPDWVFQLNRVYDKPFHLKYPLGFDGIVLPDQISMLNGTEYLVKVAIEIVN